MDRSNLDNQITRDMENITSAKNKREISINGSKIFKLTQTCFENFFEWLSLKCLDNLGQTCKQMQRIVGEYFKRNLSAVQCEIKENVMLLNCPRRCYELISFKELIKSVLFRQNRWEKDLQKFSYAAVNCKSIRKIECEYSHLGEAALECLRPILRNVETIKINRCSITDKFRSGFLEACPNLKRLCVLKGHWKFENVWLNHTYPNLVHLDWNDTLQFNELKKFFELNPNVRSFRSSIYNIWTNRHQFLLAEIKLSDLFIDFSYGLRNQEVNLLNDFHDFGIYERLHLYIKSIDQNIIETIKSLHTLETLKFTFIENSIDLTQLTQLKELATDYFIGRGVQNMTEVAMSLNLERIDFNSASTCQFFPFLYHTPTLKTMRVYSVSDKNEFDCIFDLTMINREREKLAAACKVTIYIDEEVYLGTKWVIGIINCRLIELKRVDSYDWDECILVEAERRAKNEARERKIQIKSPIFNLNIDCFDEIFDYLSFKDLNALAQTCKPLNLISGDYFHRNFPTVELDDRRYSRRKLFNFDQFIQKVRFNSKKLEPIRYVVMNCTKSLKHVHFNKIQLIDNQIEFLREILSNIETVTIKKCKISEKFYKEFLKICPKLKHLDVKDIHVCRRAIKRSGNEWLLQNYSSLEHLGWSQLENDYKISEIKTFFERNPNIQSFATSHQCLWASRDLIVQSNVKLNELTLQIDIHNCPNTEQIFGLLDEFYANGIYKRLNLKLNHYERHHIDRMASLRALTGLKLKRFCRGIILSPLFNLSELTLDESFYYENGKLIAMTGADIVATALVNLERVYFKKTILQDILSFAHHSVKLKKMKVDFIFMKKDFEYILDLAAMNEEREKLFEVRKLTIYVEESVYLATKWAHYNTDLKLIEMRRTESYE